MKTEASPAKGASLHLPVTPKPKRGVKTEYRDDFPVQAHKMCLLGALDRDLATFFGVCRETIINWKKNHPDFRDAVLRGKKAADMEVAASLYQATLDRVITTRQAIKCKEIYYDENQHYLKYWQGYPFDMAFYTGSINFITLHNETNGLGQQLSGLSVVNRLFFSDGRTDETLESFLPLIEGFNKLRLGTGIARKDIVLEKIPYKCGVYLKWLNRYGGYSYWLFEDTYSIDRSTKQLGELERDNENVETTFGRTIQIGKESQDTMKIVAELLSEDERRIVEGIIDSPKIYLFTGRPLSRNNANDWVEVVLKTSSTRIKTPKQPLTNFTFDIELPLRYTQTL